MLWDLFSDFSILELKIFRDIQTLQSKGFGQIVFSNFDESKRALELDGTKLFGKPLQLSHSSWKGIHTDQKVSSGSSYADLCVAALSAHADLTGAAKANKLQDQFYYRIPNLSTPFVDENTTKIISKIHSEKMKEEQKKQMEQQQLDYYS